MGRLISKIVREKAVVKCDCMIILYYKEVGTHLGLVLHICNAIYIYTLRTIRTYLVYVLEELDNDEEMSINCPGKY